jgi:hypothetical protein
MTTLALVAAGVTSTGGISALVVSRLHSKNTHKRRETWRT